MYTVLNHTYDEAKIQNLEWSGTDEKKINDLWLSHHWSLVGGPCYKIPLFHSLLSELPICFHYRKGHQPCSLFSLSNVWHMLGTWIQRACTLPSAAQALRSDNLTAGCHATSSSGISAQGSSLTFPSPITLYPCARFIFFPTQPTTVLQNCPMYLTLFFLFFSAEPNLFKST